jgi:histidinol dehydrogenase
MLKKIVMTSNNRPKIFAYIDAMNKTELEASAAVKNIIEDVKRNGDKAVLKYTEKFDGFLPRGLKVPASVIKKAYSGIDKRTLSAMKTAMRNIRQFHALQRKNIRDYVYRNRGYRITQKFVPVDSAGIYIPGGQAPLVSTVFMAGIPAVIAGVKKIALVSPPRAKGEVNPYILAAADMIGIKNIYRAGGAQAIAALAFGTGSIPKVDKVTGPGNIYSTMAKKYLFGTIGIDSLNGPSEITIIADDTANPEFIAYDLLAQAEHVNGHAFLITNSAKLADKVKKELENKGKNTDINAAVIIVKSLKDAVELANYKAPEHLLVIAAKAKEIIKKITNAPAIFSGNYSPVAFGDYVAGANHILPTNGTARFFSALSVLDYMKHTHIVEATAAGIRNFGPAAEKLAEIEQLTNHRLSIAARRQKK